MTQTPMRTWETQFQITAAERCREFTWIVGSRVDARTRQAHDGIPRTRAAIK